MASIGYVEKAWLAFAGGCLCMWIAIWRHSYDNIHTIHAVVITLMAIASIAEMIAEEAVYMLSLTYFLLDGFDSIRIGKYVMLIAHHIPTLGLFGAVFVFPQMLPMRYPSKVLLIEMTTPLLLRWRRTKRKDHFQVFMAAFFVVRVVYMSWLAVQFYHDVGSWVSMIANALLFVNIFWFCKQLGMLLDYKERRVGNDVSSDLAYRPKSHSRTA